MSQKITARDILEAGCGTGRWLAELQSPTRGVRGLDLSPGMLRQAREIHGARALTCGRATQLPFPNASFDLIFCVNAVHHFGDPRAFVAEARRLLRPGGALAAINVDPHSRRDRWYIYDYFDGTLEADLRRFPSSGAMRDWMIGAGFERVERNIVERVMEQRIGRDVLNDHFLQKGGTSQLALLGDAEYAAGIERIESAVRGAESRGETITFTADISFVMLTGLLES